MAVTFAGPSSFLRLPTDEPTSTGVSVGLRFRTWNEAGLLLTFKLPQQAGAVWLFLSRARLFLQVHSSGRTPLELSTGQTAAHNPPGSDTGTRTMSAWSVSHRMGAILKVFGLTYNFRIGKNNNSLLIITFIKVQFKK